MVFAAFLDRRGDESGADQVLAELRRSLPTGPWPYLQAAHLLHQRGDVKGALRWVKTGAFRHIRLDEEVSDDALLLLEMRRQLRDEMGMPEDEYDTLAATSYIAGLEEEFDEDDPT